MMIQRSNAEYLYVHVPFCKSICSYCDFTHRPYQRHLVDKWLLALAREIKSKQMQQQLKTIYIGGGTPSCLSYEQLEQLFILLKPYQGSVEEYTIEINPETINLEKVQLLKKYHVNRVSIGLQSSDPTLLKLMNRHHSYEDVKNVVDLLRENGITNISLDLMYSLPGQTMEQLEQSVRDACALNPTHLSLYSLTIEENTVFAKKGLNHLDDDMEAQMYEYICTTLEENDYHQYEVSNFCKKGFASVHNLAYWHYDDFIGLGTGASGKEHHVRYDKTRDFQTYIDNPSSQENTILSKKDEMFEMVMMSMRLKQGISMSRFEKLFHISFMVIYEHAIKVTMQNGWTEIIGDYFRCTSNGFEIMNTVLLEFLS